MRKVLISALLALCLPHSALAQGYFQPGPSTPPRNKPADAEWERFLKETPKSTNIEDRRSQNEADLKALRRMLGYPPDGAPYASGYLLGE